MTYLFQSYSQTHKYNYTEEGDSLFKSVNFVAVIHHCTFDSNSEDVM